MATPSLAARTILVVEDNYFIATEMQFALETCGARVLGPVGRVADALTLLHETPAIDGAVLDVNLHDEMVYPLADALRERSIDFVFATGYERPSIPVRFSRVQCFVKPVEPQSVARALLQKS